LIKYDYTINVVTYGWCVTDGTEACQEV